MGTLYVFIGIVIGFNGALGIWMVSGYNRMARLKNQLEESRSNLQLQWQRKVDLASELKKYALELLGEETSELKSLTQESISQEKGMLPVSTQPPGAEKEAFQKVMDSLLKKGIPSREFLVWQMRFGDLEAQFQSAKRNYNAQATEYNSLVESFPGNLLARAMNLKIASFFET